MRKVVLYLLLPVIVWSCSRGNYREKSGAVVQPISIQDGVGFDSFLVAKTKVREVIEQLGDNYEEINHNEYSIEIYYKRQGLSFYYYYPKSLDKEIFGIKFQAPFRCRTVKGIELNHATMQDVINKYGAPDWSSCEGCNYWTNDYEGIEFTIDRELSLPHFPLNEQAHVNKVIKEIFIYTKEDL